MFMRGNTHRICMHLLVECVVLERSGRLQQKVFMGTFPSYRCRFNKPEMCVCVGVCYDGLQATVGT